MSVINSSKKLKNAKTPVAIAIYSLTLFIFPIFKFNNYFIKH